MEAMDGGAFKSPMAAANIANSAIASVGEWTIQGSCIKLFQDSTESIHRSTKVREIGTVELLESGGNVVGTGVIDGNIKCGMELNGVKLCPSEVVVLLLARTRSGLIHEYNVRVHGVVSETKIKIPAHAKPHLIEYIEL
jgi:hypothetical protein